MAMIVVKAMVRAVSATLLSFQMDQHTTAMEKASTVNITRRLIFQLLVEEVIVLSYRLLGQSRQGGPIQEPEIHGPVTRPSI